MTKIIDLEQKIIDLEQQRLARWYDRVNFEFPRICSVYNKLGPRVATFGGISQEDANWIIAHLQDINEFETLDDAAAKAVIRETAARLLDEKIAEHASCAEMIAEHASCVEEAQELLRKLTSAPTLAGFMSPLMAASKTIGRFLSLQSGLN